MKAFRITAPRQGGIVELPAVQPGPGELRLGVAWLGLCGSDLSTWRGANALAAYPRIPGHEVAGLVEALGPGVEGWKLGDEALVVPYTACGSCSACRAGRHNCCRNNQTLGNQRDGALAASLVIPVEKLLRVPGLGLRDLALVEPLSVGFHAASRARIVAGETVVVIGAGGVGIGAVAGAIARGARVIVVDVDERKLELARRLGAADTMDGRRADLVAALSALDGGEGAPVLIEAAGQAVTFRACVEAAAFAGRAIYIGYAKEPVSYETRLFVQKELDIRGSRNALREDFEAAAAWLLADSSRAELLVTRTLPFAEAARAFAEWDAEPGAVTKILIDCAGGGE
ncbi:MAG: alcohol dehydrogenase catalytic domain-containing protein [Spirochaetota bacterium]